MEDLVIGIDLGTTNSCVSVYLNNQAKVLENDAGGRLTPSFVFFYDSDTVVVGEHAKGLAVNTPKNGIYGIDFPNFYFSFNVRKFSSFKTTDR